MWCGVILLRCCAGRSLYIGPFLTRFCWLKDSSDSRCRRQWLGRTWAHAEGNHVEPATGHCCWKLLRGLHVHTFVQKVLVLLVGAWHRFHSAGTQIHPVPSICRVWVGEWKLHKLGSRNCGIQHRQPWLEGFGASYPQLHQGLSVRHGQHEERLAWHVHERSQGWRDSLPVAEKQRKRTWLSSDGWCLSQCASRHVHDNAWKLFALHPTNGKMVMWSTVEQCSATLPMLCYVCIARLYKYNAMEWWNDM